MKQTLRIAGWLMVGLMMVGCQSQNTYSKLRQQEKQTISDYIEREGIRVVDEMPTVWGEKDYYAVPNYDDFYIHIIEQGTGSEASVGNIILTRYKKYGLGSYSDTTRYWTTDDGGEPVQFQYGNTSDEVYCLGWTVAVAVLKNSGGHCRIICPSKMGFTADNSSVTPYGYEFKFTVKNF